MKKVFSLLFTAGILLTACKKEKTSSTGVSMDPVDTTAALKYRAAFDNGGYGTTTGIAKIYSKAGAYSLVLDSFSVSTGPDLHVYLSKEMQPINFIDVGLLKTTSGRQVYNINGMPDFMEYKYALIHCQQYNHLFGSAKFY
ncbi:MAG: DM13 domain-containing protein [Ferruginibacter sp.]